MHALMQNQHVFLGSADLFPGSTILSGEPHSNIDLLASWLPRQGTWRICWRVSRDGWNAEKFHGGCDDKGPTITIVKVNSYIFGGYTEASWKAPEIPGKINARSVYLIYGLNQFYQIARTRQFPLKRTWWVKVLVIKRNFFTTTKFIQGWHFVEDRTPSNLPIITKSFVLQLCQRF